MLRPHNPKRLPSKVKLVGLNVANTSNIAINRWRRRLYWAEALTVHTLLAVVYDVDNMSAIFVYNNNN